MLRHTEDRSGVAGSRGGCRGCVRDAGEVFAHFCFTHVRNSAQPYFFGYLWRLCLFLEVAGAVVGSWTSQHKVAGVCPSTRADGDAASHCQVTSVILVSPSGGSPGKRLSRSCGTTSAAMVVMSATYYSPPETGNTENTSQIL